jgi:tRNA-splicing endonuclease subunit Sen2
MGAQSGSEIRSRFLSVPVAKSSVLITPCLCAVLYKKGPPFYHASYSVVVQAVDVSDFSPLTSLTPRTFSWTSLACLNRVTEQVNKVWKPILHHIYINLTLTPYFQEFMLLYVALPGNASNLSLPSILQRLSVKVK